MKHTQVRFPISRTALALLFGLASTGAALAEVPVETNSVLGTYLAARLAQNLRDTDAANSLLKAALERDPGNAGLLDQAFVSEVIAANWPKAIGCILWEPMTGCCRILVYWLQN